LQELKDVDSEEIENFRHFMADDQEEISLKLGRFDKLKLDGNLTMHVAPIKSKSSRMLATSVQMSSNSIGVFLVLNSVGFSRKIATKFPYDPDTLFSTVYLHCCREFDVKGKKETDCV
jgi:hypothetical protein